MSVMGRPRRLCWSIRTSWALRMPRMLGITCQLRCVLQGSLQWLTKVLGHHGFIKRLNDSSCSGYWIILSFIVKDLLDVENVCAKQEGHIPAGFIFMALIVHSGCLTTFVNLVKQMQFLKNSKNYMG